MDTSELLGQLHRRVEETIRDRDRLAEAVANLNNAIVQLEGEEKTITRLVALFDNQPSATTDHEKKDSPSAPLGEFSVHWPVGPGYTKPIKAKKVKSWARYKFASADWYLKTLSEIAAKDDNLERVLGVEMAVDGVLQSLSAAYDAAIYALTRAIERAVNVPKDRRTSVHLASWPKIAAEAKFFAIDLASSLSVSDALIGEHSESPEGWLAQLLLLRRHSVLQDVLVDKLHKVSSSKELYIDVPGRGQQPLIAYLTETRNLVAELLETLMHDVTDAKNGRLYIADVDQLRAQAERDLGDLLTTHQLPDS